MKEYITKLIDRNLQRKRESGITNYALYSILIILIYKIIESIPRIAFNYDKVNILMIIGFSYNLFLSIFMVLISTNDTKKRKNDLKIYYKDRNSNFEIGIFLIGILMPSILNFINFFNSFGFDSNIQVYFLATSVISIFLIAVFISILFYSREQKLDIKGEDLDAGIIYNLVFYTLIVLSITSSVFFLYTFKSFTIRKFDIFLFALYLFGIYVVMEKIIEASNNDNLIKSLEDLEYEIYVKGLDDSEIKNKLQSNYFGFLLQDWIDLKHEELKIFEEYHIDCCEKIKADEKELLTIDCSKYAIECEGRQNQIIENKKNLAKDTANFYSNKIKQIQNVVNTKKLKRENEIALVSNLIKNYQISKKKYT